MHKHRHDRFGIWQWQADRFSRGWHVLELPDFTVKLVGRANGSYWPRYEGPFWVSICARGGEAVHLPQCREVLMGLKRAKGAAVDIVRHRVMYNMEKIWAAAVEREIETDDA